MPITKRSTCISSSDFDGFTADVAAVIWNKLVELPAFQHLEPTHHVELFHAVGQALKHYEQNDRLAD